MRLHVLIASFLSIASLSTAAMLFKEDAPKSSVKRATPQTQVDIQWGVGSEAGLTDTAQK
jgi:hypothetical protein